MNGFTRLMPGGVIWFILLLVFLSGCSGGSAMLPDVDSDSSSQPSDGAASNVEMDLFNSYSSSERTLIDAYELTFNKKTNEATIAQLRTALVHYNGTPHAYGILCPNCLTPSLDPWIVQNSIEVHIDAINLYFDDGWYYAYDLRAIFVQVDTDEEEEFIYDSIEIVSPECDSTDIWFPWDETDPNPDPDESTALDPTNPFFPLYFDDYCYFDDEDYEEYQRILPPTTSPEEEIDFTLALNFNDAPDDDDDFMHALIMFDVCWFPSKYDIPNCHEPYRITFSEEDGMYPHIVAGNELEVDIRIYDHACDQGEDNNYWDDIDGDVFFYAYPGRVHNGFGRINGIVGIISKDKPVALTVGII